MERDTQDIVIVCFFITQDNWKDTIEKKIDLLLEKVSSIEKKVLDQRRDGCLLYTSPSPRDGLLSRMPSSA